MNPLLLRPKRTTRSVVDYNTEDALRKALMEETEDIDTTTTTTTTSNSTATKTPLPPPPPPSQTETSSNNNNNSNHSDVSNIAQSHPHLDWVLPCYDPDTTETQSMRQELHRLQVLKSYHILDCDIKNETTFHRLTSLAARIFNVPIAIISLVDLGRQWFLSVKGLDGAVETPRRQAFCAHTILSKSGLLVVPDATLDFRFHDNPSVTGDPFVRFYAGAPLISPEGYKLGTLCLVSPQPRCEEFGRNDQEALRDLAAMVVDAMVARRAKLVQDQQEHPVELIAYAAHDLITPLTGVNLALSLLDDDEQVKQVLTPSSQELLKTATNGSEFMMRIIQTMDSLRRRGGGGGGGGGGSSGPYRTSSSDHIKAPQPDNIILSSSSTLTGNSSSANSSPRGGPHATMSAPSPRTNLADLVQNLYRMMEPIPKAVPLMIRLDPAAPQWIVCDDLILFRSALNLITSALRRTKSGCVQLRILIREPASREGHKREASGDDVLGGGSQSYALHRLNPPTSSTGRPLVVFECEDTGASVPVSDIEYLYPQPYSMNRGHVPSGDVRLSLSCVANLIGSVKGQCGYRPRRGASHTGKSTTTTTTTTTTGSIFWFAVPLVRAKDGGSDEAANKIRWSASTASAGSQSSAGRVIPASSMGSCIPLSYHNSLASTNISPLCGIETDLAARGAGQHKQIQQQQQKPEISVHPLLRAPAATSSPTAEIKRSKQHSHAERTRHDHGMAENTTTGQQQPTHPSTVKGHTTNAKHNSSRSKGSRASTNSSKKSEKAPFHHVSVPSNVDAAVLKSMGAAASLLAMESHPDMRRQRRALVVDDSLVIRKSLAMALKKLDFDVAQAVDGLDGLKQMKNNLYDLVLCDFLMPVMDGFDCVKQYRSWERNNRSWFRQLIIGISAHANEQVAQQGKNAGMDEFRPKPITIKCLMDIQSSESVFSRSKQLDKLGNAMAPAQIASMSTVPSMLSNTYSNNSLGPAKRLRTALTSIPGPAVGLACLVASAAPSLTSRDMVTHLEAQGWNVVFAADGINALRLLRMRRWDAVIMQEELPLLNARDCMNEFRTWETANRLSRQKNTIISVEMDVLFSDSEGQNLVQPPSGFDAVIRWPMSWNDLEPILRSNKKENTGMAAIATD